MAKTQYSFSDNPNALGAPENFEITIRELVPKLGAGFIVALTGDVMTYRTSDQHFDAGHTQGWSDPYYVKGQNLSYDGQTGSIEKRYDYV